MRSAIPTFELLIVATLFLGSVALEGGLAILGGRCFTDLEWDAALRVAIDDHKPRWLPAPEVDWMPPRRSAGQRSLGSSDGADPPSVWPTGCPIRSPAWDAQPARQDARRRRDSCEERCGRSEVCQGIGHAGQGERSRGARCDFARPRP